MQQQHLLPMPHVQSQQQLQRVIQTTRDPQPQKDIAENEAKIQQANEYIQYLNQKQF